MHGYVFDFSVQGNTNDTGMDNLEDSGDMLTRKVYIENSTQQKMVTIHSTYTFSRVIHVLYII